MMSKVAKTTRESEAELAHLREQFEISLAQIRAGQFLTEEESIADLEQYEAELDEADRARGIIHRPKSLRPHDMRRPVNRVVPETEDPKAARERELHRHLQASYAQALAGDLISEEESLARVERIESGDDSE